MAKNGLWKPDKAAYQASRPAWERKMIRNVKARLALASSKSAVFFESQAWKELRYQALLKYGRKCACCGATPSTGAIMQVDHIKPRSRYPRLALTLDNLQVLCKDCNQGKSNKDSTDFR